MLVVRTSVLLFLFPLAVVPSTLVCCDPLCSVSFPQLPLRAVGFNSADRTLSSLSFLLIYHTSQTLSFSILRAPLIRIEALIRLKYSTIQYNTNLLILYSHFATPSTVFSSCLIYSHHLLSEHLIQCDHSCIHHQSAFRQTSGHSML